MHTALVSCRRALFEPIRKIFVMIYKGKGSPDDMTKYRCSTWCNGGDDNISSLLGHCVPVE